MAASSTTIESTRKPDVTYSPEVADRIIERIATGEGLMKICADPDMPTRANFLIWVNQNFGGLQSAYARARLVGYDCMAEHAVMIADDTSEDANSRRVRVDTRKWLLAKLHPAQYGDRIMVDQQITLSSPADVLRGRMQQADGTIEHQAEPKMLAAPAGPAVAIITSSILTSTLAPADEWMDGGA